MVEGSRLMVNIWFRVHDSWSNFGSRFTVYGSRLLVVKD